MKEMSDSLARLYAKIPRKRKWLAERAKPYLDCSIKDALLPPEFPRLQCVCEEHSKIIQSTHPTTADRAYYTCGNILLEMRCNFFQWIDDPDMYDRAFIEQMYILNYAIQDKIFEHWKPYVPDRIENAPEEHRKEGWWWRTPE